jgi:peptidoglycan/LPS O-acetylase OafA/YrhL
MRPDWMNHRLPTPLARQSASDSSHTTNQRSIIMPRFLSWLALALAAAFLVVVSASFSLTTIGTLAFAISIGTLVVSAGIAVYDRRYVPSLITAVLVAVISAWTIVASLIFSQSTVQNLALGASLAIGGLAVVGLTAHEVSHERAAQSLKDGSTEREGRLAAAA